MSNDRRLTDAHRALVLEHIIVAHRASGAARKRYPAVIQDDLQGAAFEGLCRAARDWDPMLTPDFESYAAARCKHAIIDELRRFDWLPRNGRSLHNRYWAAFDELCRTSSGLGGNAPRPDDVADAMGIPVSERRKLFHAAGITYVSLDAFVFNSGHEWLDPSVDVSDEAIRTVITAQIRAAVATLPPRLAQVYRRRFEDGAPQHQIAAELGVTAPRISQMCREIERRLALEVNAA